MIKAFFITIFHKIYMIQFYKIIYALNNLFYYIKFYILIQFFYYR